MIIENCNSNEIVSIMELYEAARTLQKERKMVVWPYFEPEFIQREVDESRQWKISLRQTIVCNWAVTFEDKQIWEERDAGNSIFIHRIACHPQYRGNRYIDSIVGWAIEYAKGMNKRYVRLDTLGNNAKLIQHYKSAGLKFLGMYKLNNTSKLPLHYQKEPNCCLFEIDLYSVDIVYLK